ncbi:MAG: anhydro-N-acetylmuramic acid kinase [Proteobacteria bacterium]|nr:anhydro-N-acetylmuramic acid kinase [Pseudomonadota bacterium]
MGGQKALLALGLMSGTSLDGIDAALVLTDGLALVEPGAALTVPYAPALRERLRATIGGRGDVAAVERDVTRAHAAAVSSLLEREGLAADAVDAIGFHGHTIVHRPAESLTWQIGDGALLAELTGIDVVCDFRSRDVAAGGKGAPLAPLYHAARAAPLGRPVAVLNLGGVANVTWLGEDGAIRAFDTGPGCALLDDWARRHGVGDIDAEGALARAGRVDDGRVKSLLQHAYFRRPPPKSLDRDEFAGAADGLSAGDGAATLAAFTAGAVGHALTHLPAPPTRWLVTGGGRRNPVLMERLRRLLGVPVEAVEAVGWNGDALEAEAFAYLAVRALRRYALTLPETTGAPRPLPGGALHRHATIGDAGPRGP